jgi:hypothetical protein
MEEEQKRETEQATAYTQPVVDSQEVPYEVSGWNWGAFALTIYWGIGNKVYLSLLRFIPIFGIIWAFVCGAKGNEWAWKKGGYGPNDMEAFKKTQKTWGRAGLFAFIFFVISYVLLIIIYFAIFAVIFAHHDYFSL